ncbi:MAG: class I SAM-dependent methyltransferase [Gammaproteobacteria bacterium]|nr:MAG: class I SAM-dependent methyltransferase [Gammaproteobacteria bacterium]
MILPDKNLRCTGLQANACVDPGAGSDRQRAVELARSLGLEIGDKFSTAFQYCLYYENGHLFLLDRQHRHGKPFYLDFVKTLSAFTPADCSRKQPLARAVGVKHHSIWDVTAGFAQDALLLVSMGYGVRAIERCPVVFAMLSDACQRLQKSDAIQNSLVSRLRFSHADAIQILQTVDCDDVPEVIYLDPMYPPKRKKSAQVRKRLRVLRELVGDDNDAEKLCLLARQVAGKRVVVKRPVYAEPLLADPDIVFAGKLVRYDVYLQH